MTIALQLNHTYRTRDGSAEHTIDRIDDVGVAWAGNEARWRDTGEIFRGYPNEGDLVEDVTEINASRYYTKNPTGPVRQTTTTRTEIVPGTYGPAWVGGAHEGAATVSVPLKLYTAEELDDLAVTATQLAQALRAIASENQS